MKPKSKHIGLIVVLALCITSTLIAIVLTEQERSDVTDISSENYSREAKEAEQEGSDDADAFWRLQLQDENGYIPPDGMIKAAEHVQAMRLARQSLSPTGGGIEPQDWTWLGPTNIGGRVRALLIHPTIPTTMWAGSDTGGIWKTTDGGMSWQAVDDFMANLNIFAMVMDPNNPDIIYAGTGELRGAGVFKSTDGGISWTQLPATLPVPPNQDWYRVNALTISPNSSTLLAANGLGCKGSNSNTGGIWRSIDGGESWSQTITSNVLDVAFHLTNSNLAVATGCGQAWYSTNGGVTWNTAAGPVASETKSRAGIAYAPGDPSIVYTFFNRDVQSEIWRSIDGGQNYTLMSTGKDFYNTIWIDPINSNHLIIGHVDLWRSNDGGITLTQITGMAGQERKVHVDHYVITEHPDFNGTTNTLVFSGNDGGIYKTDNIYEVHEKNDWQALNTNLGITQFYGAAGNITTGVIIGGTQDNGTLRYTGDPEGWSQLAGGDGGFSAADLTDPNYFYGEYQWMELFRSSDGGIKRERIDGRYWDGHDWQWKEAPYFISDSKDRKILFIAPFILDLDTPNRLLAGGQSLWRTNDAKTEITPTTSITGPTWERIKEPIEGAETSYISAIAVASGNSDLIWVGHTGGQIFKTTNGTVAAPTWERIDIDSPPNLPSRYVGRITIDPNDSNVVYVTFGGFSPDNVWRSVDGGLTWNDISGSGLTGLPDVPVHTLVIHPNHPNWLYVGTELGIFTTENAGDFWFLPQDGPSNVIVKELFWMDDTLVAVTHGRGLFQAIPTNTGILKQIYLPLIVQ